VLAQGNGITDLFSGKIAYKKKKEGNRSNHRECHDLFILSVEQISIRLPDGRQQFSGDVEVMGTWWSKFILAFRWDERI